MMPYCVVILLANDTVRTSHLVNNKPRSPAKHSLANVAKSRTMNDLHFQPIHRGFAIRHQYGQRLVTKYQPKQSLSFQFSTTGTRDYFKMLDS